MFPFDFLFPLLNISIFHSQAKEVKAVEVQATRDQLEKREFLLREREDEMSTHETALGRAEREVSERETKSSALLVSLEEKQLSLDRRLKEMDRSQDEVNEKQRSLKVDRQQLEDEAAMAAASLQGAAQRHEDLEHRRQHLEEEVKQVGQLIACIPTCFCACVHEPAMCLMCDVYVTCGSVRQKQCNGIRNFRAGPKRWLQEREPLKSGRKPFSSERARWCR